MGEDLLFPPPPPPPPECSAVNKFLKADLLKLFFVKLCIHSRITLSSQIEKREIYFMEVKIEL